MPVDADEVVVAADASVHVGDVGTAGPTDIATALNAAFVDLGYTSEDGIEMTPGMDIGEVRAHQAMYPVRRMVTGRSLELGLTLLQWNQASIELAFGGGTWTTTAGPPAFYTYTPPAPEDMDYRALVLEWEDGTKAYRLHVPKVLVTETSSITLARTDASGLPLTFSVIATDGTDPFTLITSDPAFA
jgi:hypothetical protein